MTRILVQNKEWLLAWGAQQQLGLKLHIDLDDPELDLPVSDRTLARQWLQSSRLHRVLNLFSRGALVQCPLCVYDLFDDVVVIVAIRP